MRFSSIKITNFRQYKNLNLEFRKDTHDLQVIVGDNGTGKTNLLNAFTWCLYGSEPHLGSEKTGKGEPRLNKATIFEMVERRIEIEDVSVVIELETDDGLLRIKRSVPFRVLGRNNVTELKHKESFTVVVSFGGGNDKAVSDDIAQSYVDRLLPERICEYFFFDGEQLGAYFDDDRSEILKSSVHSISKIDSIAEMKRRTRLTAQKLAKAASPKSGSGLEEALRKKQKCEENIATLKESISKDLTEKERLEAKISELDARLRGLPDVGVLEHRIVRLKAQRKDRRQILESALESYCSFSRKMFVNFAFYETAKGALAAISKLEAGKQLPPPIDPSHLKGMLKSHVCDVCKRPLSKEDEGHLLAALELFRVDSETTSILAALRSELRNVVRAVEGYPREKKKMLEQLSAAESTLAQTEEELRLAEDDYTGCPNPEQVKQMRAQRKEFEALRDSVVGNISRLETRLGDFRRGLSKYQEEYRKALQSSGLIDGARVAADFGERAAMILEQVESDAVDETRRLIGEQTERLFKGLVWKDSKCDHIDLTSGYQLSLYDRYGFSCAGTCSAAERNLLALSFTLAMHNVSGFESPMFIDTPTARASGDNRANFAETLAEVSRGKQLILTFTPDEYSESIARVFDPIAASRMSLSMDGNEMVVSLKGGN